MFEQLFGSGTRVKLMKLFLENPEKKYYVRQITRKTDCLINSVRRELKNLLGLGFLVEVAQSDQSVDSTADGTNITDVEQKNSAASQTKRFYALNKYNIFRHELENLFSKGKILVEKKFGERLTQLGTIKYLAMSGVFVNDKKSLTDLIIVGEFDKAKIQKAIKQFEKEIGHKLNYTLMDSKEYRLRKDIADRFLNDIIYNEKNLVVVDELKEII